MSLYNELIHGNEKLALVGLGYVGIPIAVAFAKKVKVVGYDCNQKKIEKFRGGIDPTNGIGNEVIRSTTIEFTSDPTKLKEAKFFIVAVPTPVDKDNKPDLEPVKSASQVVGKNLNKGSIVVFESTVYPGVTEDICVPCIEKESGLKCGIDWKIGYSPERINPGDKRHKLENIVKIVSGIDEDALDIIAKVYELVVKAGVYRAKSIKVAEAAKVIENSQRDINIAFMNELTIIFHKMGIDMKSVLDAAKTKWNFLDFEPGLVGGHCIGVDPYYLTYRAEQLGYRSRIILSGRHINDSMGRYIAESLVKLLIKNDIVVKGSKVAIWGFTFKENFPDMRNTKVIDIYNELGEYGIIPVIVDPHADKNEVKEIYDIELKGINDIKDVDALVIAVKHKEFEAYNVNDLKKFFKNSDKSKVLLDIKGMYNMNDFCIPEWEYWRL